LIRKRRLQEGRSRSFRRLCNTPITRITAPLARTTPTSSD
jgi:hypothetical protein